VASLLCGIASTLSVLVIGGSYKVLLEH
jgi:hypothetical protein